MGHACCGKDFFLSKPPRLDLFNIEIRGMGGCHLESGFLSFSVLCSFLWQSIFRQQYAGQTCFPLAHCSPLGVPLVVSPLACPGLSFHGALANTQQCLAHPTTNGLSHREAKKLGHVKALGGALAERSHKHESLAPLEGRRKAPRTHQPSYPKRYNPSASQGWTIKKKTGLRATAW